MMVESRKNIRWSVYLLIILVLITGSVTTAVFSGPDSGELRVAFLDVGQGDAIFIETPEGVQVLIDGGNGNQLFRSLSEQIPFYDRSIDMVLATHGDADHIGALPDLFTRFHIAHVITNGAPPTSAAMEAFSRAREKEQATELLAQRGQKIYLGSDVYLYILFPDRVANIGRNAGSIIARLVYGDTEFLFTGDAPRAIEEYITKLGTSTLKSTVLKVGHHGSDTSSARQFLEYVQPEYAVIQASADNRYGHPHEEVLNRLEEIGARVLCTCEEGTVVFESDGEHVFLK